MRSLVRLVTVIAVIATGLIVPTVADLQGSTPTGSAQAADLRFFDPGNIISDAVFYDALSMSTADVQYFLDVKGASCQPGTDGTPCLKNYAAVTTDRAADSLCSGYRAGGSENAATIITRVAAACRVSPRVLLVLLQKEMGLVTGTKPTAKKYERAAGYACPDSANGGCDPRYAGLQNQLYWSAWQYRKYAANPAGYAHVAGRVNSILWSPNACGSSQVFITNQATAGLYNYTPYRPNQAALNAGYGTGDGCSAYGNRNFWNYFTDWFGSTQSPAAGAIYAKYTSLGADGGGLGQPTSTFLCGARAGGCWQSFRHGLIFWSPATGAFSVAGAMLEKWNAMGREWSALGYPLTDMICGLPQGGCGQHFERGVIYWTQGTGPQVVLDPMKQKWASLGWETSTLGYPTSDQFCGLTAGGCWQAFQGGTMYWTPGTGARYLAQPIATKWWATGNEGGSLGYPVTDTICGLASGGCGQLFERGSIYSTPGTGAHVLTGAAMTIWQTAGWETSTAFGYPTTDWTCGLVGKGCYQAFERGSVYASPDSGTRLTTGPIRDKYATVGNENGALRYPTLDTMCGLVGGGCWQAFQGGAIYWTAGTGAHDVRTRFFEVFQASGAEWGTLGYPTSDQICGLPSNGCGQHFERGSIYDSPATGAHPVSGAIRDSWAAQEYEAGPWGYPISGPKNVAGGVEQRFAGGTARSSTATGTVTFG